MHQRLLTGLVCLPILFVTTWRGNFWFLSAVTVCAIIATSEFQKMTLLKTHHKPRVIVITWTIALLLVGQYSVGITQFLYISLITIMLGMFVTLLWAIIFSEKRAIYRTWLITSLGAIYIGFCLSHALALRNFGVEGDLGKDWILFSLILIFTSDTGAYIVGKTVGKHHMAPTLSPNKTWEGTIAGFLLVIMAALSINEMFFPRIIYWQVLLISATVGLMAPIGDLFESKLKRIYGLKDTGAILPGHGGMLDRMDSILLAIPFVYYLVITLTNH